MPRSPMADVLHAISSVELPAPEDVPNASALAERLTPALRKSCLAALASPTARPTAALAALRRAMPEVSPEPWQDIRFLIDTGQPADDGTHDYFFRIRRQASADALGYLRGLFLALDRLVADLAEAPTGLRAASIAELGDGLLAAIAAALQARPPGESFASHPIAAPARPDFEKWRWIRGHQIFAALTQGLIFSCDALSSADASRDDQALNAAAELCRVLMLASARALEFTGDLSLDLYQQSIRVSMEKPYLPKGFSGVLSSDHRRFVSKMRALRPTIERLRAVLPQAHAGLAAALAAVYDSHKFVCAHFVGTDKASLLMAAECTRSAVDQLERFKQMRMRALL